MLFAKEPHTQIENELEKSKDSFELIEGFKINSRDIIKKVYYYYNSQFLSGEIDSDGWKKSFFNKSRPKALATAKEIDIDTKDLRLRAKKNSDIFKALVAKEDLKRWMKKNYFGDILNEIGEQYCWLGHVVVKKDKNSESGISIVDLRNFYWDVGVEERKDMDFIIEKHLFSPTNLPDKWDTKELEKYINLKKLDDDVVVYERYGKVPGDWVDSEKDFEMACLLYANYGGKWFKLDAYKIKEDPYEELRFERVKGRYLGRGVIETLFDAQWSINKHINLRRKNFEISSKRIFLTKDSNLQGKSLINLKTGTILETEDQLSQIDNRDLNYSPDVSEQQIWEGLSNDLTFTHSLVMGEKMPSGTTARSSMLSIRATNKFFDKKRENFGLFIKKIFDKFIVKKLKSDLDRDKFVEFTIDDPDFSEVRDNVVRYLVLKEIKKRIKDKKDPLAGGKIRQIIVNSLDNRKVLPVEIHKGFYSDFDCFAEMVITGESIDLDSQIANLQWLLAAVSANPQAIENENTRRIIFSIAEKAGVNPYTLFRTTETRIQPAKIPTAKKEQGLRIPEEEKVETKL